jgi:PGF-CTERM protein
MYDVNFGGIEHMTKRLSIALVAVALFVLLAVMPVSAVTDTNSNGTIIEAGATVFIGEEGFNLTHAMNSVQANTGLDNTPALKTIGWWASAATLGTTSPTKTLVLDNTYKNFQVSYSDFVGYTGNWYLLDTDGKTPMPTTATAKALINVQDPTLSVAVWDWGQSKDVTGLQVPQGQHLTVQVNTNMHAATLASQRNNTISSLVNGAADPTSGSGYMPDGSSSSWNKNSTGYANGSYSELISGTKMYKVYNGTIFNRMTYGWNISGTYYAYYYNASTPINENYPWTAGNYTENEAGTVLINPTTWAAYLHTGAAPVNAPTTATDGYITIKVKDEAGATYSSLVVGAQGGVYNATSITKQFVNKQPWYFGDSNNYWVTDATDANGQYSYPVGTYSVWAESLLNKMKDNYKNGGADYTGKTISATGTVTLVSDTVKIEANKDSVVRSKAFSVTVTGKPSTNYWIWVKGTSAMTGGYDDMPPQIVNNQADVTFDDAVQASLGTHPIGNYQYENGAGKSVWDDVAKNKTGINTYNRTRYYAKIKLSNSGTRTVEWTTNNWTKAQKYTIRVEGNFTSVGSTAITYKSDEVDVNVEKGAVTIVAAGDQSYYLGEEIKFSGTNTETYKTYLFMVGPNLPEDGAVINDAAKDPRNAGSLNPGVATNVISDFKEVDVNGDNTWSWKWGTASFALDAGTYTIYAVSQPYNKKNLANAAYGTVSVIIKKPFVSATASQSTVAKGDRIYISGTAQGDPSSVQIWIMGKNYAVLKSASVNSDASFKYEVKQEDTKTLSSGQYFVVVQHPMQNGEFDVALHALDDGTNPGYVYNKQLINSGATGSTTTIFKLLGSNSLQGSDAAEALAQGINDANVDDTYTKLQFLIEEPTITVDAIGDKHVGDKFTITAKTNLAVDDEVLVQVYSSSFKPTQKSQSGEFSGATATVKVVKGDSGMNKISFDVDSSTFKPDEYIVTEDAVLQTATGTALFNVLESSAVVVTTAPAVVTTAPAAVTTTAPAVVTSAPVATTKPSPGFGALIALIGLGAVAFVVVRRH